jgi:hypothetical protein
MGKLVSLLYRLARLLNDIRILLSGDPVRIGRRVRNKVVGRYIFGRFFRW